MVSGLVFFFCIIMTSAFPPPPTCLHYPHTFSNVFQDPLNLCWTFFLMIVEVGESPLKHCTSFVKLSTQTMRDMIQLCLLSLSRVSCSNKNFSTTLPEYLTYMKRLLQVVGVRQFIHYHSFYPGLLSAGSVKRLTAFQRKILDVDTRPLCCRLRPTVHIH